MPSHTAADVATPGTMRGRADRDTAPPMPVPSQDDASRAAGRAGPRPVRLRGRRPWLWAAVALVLIGAAIVAWRLLRGAPPTHYVTAPVTTGTVARTVTASGSVNPVMTVQVGTYVSGVITDLSCDYNTKVTKGQLCAKIDPRPYQTTVDSDRASLSSARAQLAKDQTNLNYTTLSYQRALDLFAHGLVSQDQRDSAKNANDQAQAQVNVDKAAIAERQAALSAADVSLGYTDIVSPVDGTVVARNVTMGQTVAASFQTPTLFLIATDLTKMQVDANVSETDIAGVVAGKAATFTVSAFADHPFRGQVEQVRQAPQTVQNVVTYDVVVTASNPDLLLKPGMTATVRIVVDERQNVTRVPDAALRYVPGGLGAGRGPSHNSDEHHHEVWVLRNGTPVAVAVTTGLDDDANSEVTAGDLHPGDQVIVSEQGSGGSAPRTSGPPRLPRM